MVRIFDVRYVRLGTDDLESATRFATDIVGLDVARRTADAAYFKSDQRDHTLAYFDGDPRDQALGLELYDPNDLDKAAAEFEEAGYPARLGSKEECEKRGVRAFISTTDPTGNTLEIVARPFESGVRYHGTRDAGIVGFHHIGLCTTDAPRDEAFWTKVLNARVSDWISDAALLRIRTGHHAVALFPASTKGIQHVNHQVESADDVMRSYYFLKSRNVRIQFGPGRHPTSSAMFLYFAGPHGVVFEYSHGLRNIQPEEEANYRPHQYPWDYNSMCYWGSKPEMPTLQVAKA
jgi:2,3-dihydroxy-p-cumate/2,3-dihydroxybenzoate 3,4-dioxygenase